MCVLNLGRAMSRCSKKICAEMFVGGGCCRMVVGVLLFYCLVQ